MLPHVTEEQEMKKFLREKKKKKHYKSYIKKTV